MVRILVTTLREGEQTPGGLIVSFVRQDSAREAEAVARGQVSRPRAEGDT